MAYSELIKNFEKIRAYMRDFYVYGFRQRDDFTEKSSRSYDDERRRIESYMGDNMRFRNTSEGKTVFISVDSRVMHRNPLYNAWKSSSFTDGDITLHFILLDILYKEVKSVPEIMNIISCDYLSFFDDARYFDESTVRHKLTEYVKEGILLCRKSGKTMYYTKNTSPDIKYTDALGFYSETAPLGVIGSYLLDANVCDDDKIYYKHHYITHTIDSGILFDIFCAIHDKCNVSIEYTNKKAGRTVTTHVTPLRVFISVQGGRQYLLGFDIKNHMICSFRIDNILSVQKEDISENFDMLRTRLDRMQKNMWGVVTKRINHTEHIDFTLHFEDDEKHIYHRLMRESRCGKVELIDNNTCRFSADVYDVNEMLPWIRTFICRIQEINISNKEVERIFRQDLQKMYEMYGILEDI